MHFGRKTGRGNSHLTGRNPAAGSALPAIDRLLNWLSEPKISNILPLGGVGWAVAFRGWRCGAFAGTTRQAGSVEGGPGTPGHQAADGCAGRGQGSRASRENRVAGYAYPHRG